MQHGYGRAVVEERSNPRHYAELSRYLRMEYGPGTGPGYFMRELANGASPSRKGLAARAFSALAKAVRTLAPNNGRRTENPEPTR